MLTDKERKLGLFIQTQIQTQQLTKALVIFVFPRISLRFVRFGVDSEIFNFVKVQSKLDLASSRYWYHTLVFSFC